MRLLLRSAFATLIALAPFAARAAEAPPQPVEKPHIDIVFCIDCSGSMGRGIMVDACCCGDCGSKRGPRAWRECGKVGGGSYMEIAGQGGGVVVATPFDKELAELSGKLNTTYVGYGLQRQEKAAAQSANDATAGRYNIQSAADRAVSKSSRQYDNATWDLVDASRDKDFDITKVKEEELPDDLKKMTVEQRKEFVATKAKERDDVAKQIRELSTKRDAYVKEEISKKGLDTNKSFDEAVRKSINEQAAKRGFEFEKSEK